MFATICVIVAFLVVTFCMLKLAEMSLSTENKYIRYVCCPAAIFCLFLLVVILDYGYKDTKQVCVSAGHKWDPVNYVCKN